MSPRVDHDALLRAFGSAVRARREELSLTQEELAFRAEVDRTYLSGVERGVRNPTVKALARITFALEIEISALFLATEKVLRRRG